MDAIKAFVGHSFTPEDSPIVSVILTYLDGISELNPRFSWEHAEHPEPAPVDSKILRLLEDKNLFIGICTRKERVISPSALKRSWLDRRTLRVNELNLEWKTSDWIIQEIGLAIGKNMKIILLVEDGIRSPGTLQGNLEYIPLPRETPEKSFKALLGMLATLCRDSGVAQTPPEDIGPATTQEDDSPRASAVDSWITPAPGWTKKDYQFALMHCIATSDEIAEKKVHDHFLASEIGGSELSRKAWAAHGEYFRIAFGRGGNLATLETLHAESPSNSEISAYLARGYLHYQEHGKAADAFQQAADTETDPEKEIKLLGEAALSNQKAGNPDRAQELSTRMRQRSSVTGLGEVEVLKAEKRLAEEQKVEEVELAAQERLLEIRPDDDETRFSLAYKYSDLDRNELAAYHYLRIPEANRNAVTWNNLGVSFASLGMPIKSVEAYREAERKGETLAMSNLANKFLDAGFLDEAQKILDAAMQIKDHHQNIDRAFGKVKDAIEAEKHKQTTILEKAKPLSEYYRLFGQSLAKPLPLAISGKWRAPQCELDLTTKDSTVVARGLYEVMPSGLGLISSTAFGFGTAAKNEPTPVKYVLEYRGVIRGQTIVGSVSRERVDQEAKKLSTLLSHTDSDPIFLMWIADNGKEIFVCEYSGSNASRFYSFSRL